MMDKKHCSDNLWSRGFSIKAVAIKKTKKNFACDVLKSEKLNPPVSGGSITPDLSDTVVISCRCGELGMSKNAVPII